MRYSIIGGLVALGLALASTTATGHEPVRIVLGADGEHGELTLGPLRNVKGRGKKFTGTGLLLRDGLPTQAVNVTRKVNAKKGRLTYTLRSLKGDPVKLRAKIRASGEPEEPDRVKVLLKEEGAKTKLRRPDDIAFLDIGDPLPGEEDDGLSGASVALNTNPTDEMIAVIRDADASTIAFYGPKDEDGAATRIDSALVTNAAGATTSIVFDATGRPLQMIGDDGAVQDFQWYSDSIVAITYTTADGGVTARTVYDLVHGDEAAGDGTDFVPPDVPDDPPAPVLVGKTTQNIRVRIFSGRDPYDPPAPPSYVRASHVSVEIGSSDSRYNGSLRAVRAGPGVYDATLVIEGPSIAERAYQRLLDNIGRIHSATCFTVTSYNPAAFTGACVGVGAAAAAIPGVQLAAPAITAACTTIIGAYYLYCQVMKFGGPGNLDDDLEGYLLPKLTQFLGIGTRLGTNNGTVFLRARVSEWNEFTGSLKPSVAGEYVRAKVKKDGRLNRSTLEIHLEAAKRSRPGDGEDIDTAGSPKDEQKVPKVLPPTATLRMSPGRPGVGQQYTATASVTNLPRGGRATLSIASREFGEVATTQVTEAAAGSAGPHTLVLQRTLGRENAHYAYVQVFDGKGRRLLIRQINY